MRKIERRAMLCLLLAAALTLGLAVFCFRFFLSGGRWVSFAANRHLYNSQGELSVGRVLDRDGDVLSWVDENGDRVYYGDATVRKATLHVVGDPQGRIGSGALVAFADKLSGYNPVTGAYSLTGAGNRKSFFSELSLRMAGGQRFQVILVGLEQFGRINRQFGHWQGDSLLCQVARQLDLEAMYANAIACNCLGDASLPCTVEDEETAVRVALKCCRGIDRDNPKIIRIQNTLHLEYIEVSPALLDDVKANPKLTLVDQI